jgi:Cu+-exporting ATPase
MYRRFSASAYGIDRTVPLHYHIPIPGGGIDKEQRDMIRKERYDITGMSCASCSAHVEKAVSGLNGMKSCQVNLLTNSMNAEYDDSILKQDDIIRAVDHAGYGARRKEERDETGSGRPGEKREKDSRDLQAEELKSMENRLRVSFLFLIPLMYLTMGHMAGLPLPGIFQGPENAEIYAFTQMLLVLPVMLVNRKYYTGGIRAIFHRAPNMDSLISVGSLAAFLYGIAGIYGIGYALGHGDIAAAGVWRGNLYFESVSMILTLITLGKYFETRSKAKTSAAIGKLLNLTPETAHVLRDGKETVIPAEEVRKGDILIVRPGESIPADGILREGITSVDESAITGESIPADKNPGDMLTGATINLNGSICMEVTRTGGDSTLARIIALVEEASSSKAPISRLADRISGIFVPVVMGIALITFLIWMAVGGDLSFSLSAAISVLVISCPCALGLATPVAVMVGTGKAAEYGILFKSAEALEILHEAKVIVFDKTGTITEGKPAVTDIIPAPGVSEEELLLHAASAENGSVHPLSRAVISEAAERKITLLPASDFTEVPGKGISALVSGRKINAGNNADGHMETEHVTGLSGKTLLYFDRDGKSLGTIAVADTIKKDSSAAVHALKKRGLRPVLLTGDRREAAEAIAGKAGIDEVIAGVLPDGKEDKIRSLQQEGKKVIMVGDGINDSPALTRSDVGIAIGAGTDIAIDSADVVLMKNSLFDIVTAVDLSRAVIRNIKENLFWAFFYNSVGIPLAAGVFYFSMGWKLSPMFGAAAMSMSSVCVVSNALRLRGFRPKEDERDVPENSGQKEVHPAESREEKEKTKMTTTIKVNGMMCGHCKATVEKALKSVPGVGNAEADLEKKQAVIEHDGTVSEEALIKAVNDAGYEASK